ncbi:hypothetical protein K8R78_06760 [bacterium]|nr:hypothetical protein [bacterium]
MKLKLTLGVLGTILAVTVLAFAVGGMDLTYARASQDSIGGGFIPTANKVKYTHEVGNIGLIVQNDMEIGNGAVENTMEWPLGSSMFYLYDAYIWFGNRDAVIQGWFQNQTDWVAKSEIYDSLVSTPEPEFPATFDRHEGLEFGWMSEFWRTTTPSPVGDQDAHWYVDDTGGYDDHDPLGLNIMVQSMAWGAPGHDEWVIFNYFIRYIGTNDLDPNSFMAFAFDMDVGSEYFDDLVEIDGNELGIDDYNNITWSDGADGLPDEYDAVNYPILIDGSSDTQPYWGHFNGDDYADDYVGDGTGTIAVPRLMGYMFNVTELPGEPGYAGIRVLRACVNPGMATEREYIVTASHSWDQNNDPADDTYKFAYMSDVGVFEEIENAYDWRVCPSMGPFADSDGRGLQTDDVLEVRMVYVIGDGANGLRANSDLALTDCLGFNGQFDDPKQGDEVDDMIVLSPPASPLLSGVVTGSREVTLHFNPEYEIGRNLELEGDVSSADQVDFEGYRIYRARTLDQLGDGTDLTAWDGDGDQPNYLRHTLTQWDKDINDASHWPAGGQPWKAPGYEGNDNDQYEEFNTLNNWADIFADAYDGEGFAANTGGSIYEFVDKGSYGTYQDKPLWDKWPNDDYDVPKPEAPQNHFTYYYSVIAFDYGASPLYNTKLTQPYMSMEGGVRANYISITLETVPDNDSLDSVLVVPNPYVGGVDWQQRSNTGIVQRKLAFTNLPSRCSIRIYTIAGDLVDIIEHNDATSGTAWWDLQSRNNMEVASGVYVYHIEAPGLGTSVGKFAVLMGERL